MLLNRSLTLSETRTIPGTRLLQNDMGLIGAEVGDPKEPRRQWRIHAVYAPLPGRALGGIRVKLVDQKGFISFCNQRDLEVLLGIGTPGNWCRWLGNKYVDVDDSNWFGLCVDEEDLLDDLLEREINHRALSLTHILYPPLDIIRFIHLEDGVDVEERHVLIWDRDLETGICPDPRLETIQKRWIRSQRERVRWDRI